MTDEPDIELVIAQLLSNRKCNGANLSDEQAKKLAKAAKGLSALNHLTDTKRVSTKTIDASATHRTDFENSSLPSDHIGRFEIKGTLGVGGHGLVFLAFDPKLEREVALKIPNMDSALDSESQQRFARESRAAAILSHPTIVPLFESGNIGPVHYIVYKYCPGVNLSNWNKLHSIQSKPGLAAKIVAQLSEAVEHAHQRGVVHRDLKPSNILLESKTEAKQLLPEQLPDCLRIADFGLAKFTSDTSTLTRTRGIVGTPEYMSPEQADGAPDVGARSDIYSLGAILYELLTGQPPHRKDSLVATLRSVSNDPVVAPRKLNRSVPRDLEMVCLKCLEKKPGDRYGSAFELNSDLIALVEDRPISIAKPTFAHLTEKWIRRNPILVRAATVSLLISLVTLGCALYWVNNARQDERAANQAAQANLQRAREIVKDFFVMTETELEDLPGDSSIRKRLAQKSVKYFEEFEQLVDRQDPSSLEDLANARARLGRILDSNNQFALAITRMEQALDEFKRLSERSDLSQTKDPEAQLRIQYQSARIKVDLGSAYTNIHQIEQGRNYNQQAIKELTDLERRTPADWINDQLINALIDRGTILSTFREMDEAQRVQKKTLALIASRKMTPSLHRKQAFLFLEMAKTCAVKQELEKALSHYLEAKVAFIELAANTRQNQFLQLLVAKCKVRIVSLRRRLGQPIQGSIQAQSEIVKQLDKLAKSNPERPSFQFDYALGLFDLASFHAAEKRVDEAIDINKELVKFLKSTEERTGFIDAEGRVMLGGAFNNLALCYLGKSQYRLAEDAIRSAIPYTKYATRAEPNNLSAKRFLINHYYGLGEILTTLEKHEDAIEAMGKAAELAGKFCNSGHANITQHSQLHSILGKRLTLLESAGEKEKQLANLETRISAGLHLLQNGDPKFQKYYKQELNNDLERLLVALIELRIDDPESIVRSVLNSETQAELVHQQMMHALESIRPKQKTPESKVMIKRIQMVIDSHN